ncbi:hypothetical protein FRC09_013974, partial [Ceratobasidium sp. 395]
QTFAVALLLSSVPKTPAEPFTSGSNTSQSGASGGENFVSPTGTVFKVFLLQIDSQPLAEQTHRSFDRRGMPVEMVKETGYGRLNFLLALVLPPNLHFDIHDPQVHILAHLAKAKDAAGDAATERVSYRKMGRSFVLELPPSNV